MNELTKTPLLLALLCLVFDDAHQFPVRRVDLYKETLDVWLRKWDSSRDIIRDDVYKHLPPTRREQMLSRIAAQNFEKGIYFITIESLASQIEQYVGNLDLGDNEIPPRGEIILKSIEAQHGILVERAFGIYSFSHNTFQEFLTARYIVANAAKGTVEKLTEKYLLDGRWHEVFLMTASLLDDAEILFDTSLKKCGDILSQNPKATKLVQWATQSSILLQNETPIIRVSLVYKSIDKIFDKYLWALASIGGEYLEGGKNRIYNTKLLDDATVQIANDKLADKIDILRVQIRDFMFELEKSKYTRVVDVLDAYKLREIKVDLLILEEDDVDALLQFTKANRLLCECLSLSSLQNRNAMISKLFRI